MGIYIRGKLAENMAIAIFSNYLAFALCYVKSCKCCINTFVDNLPRKQCVCSEQVFRVRKPI